MCVSCVGCSSGCQVVRASPSRPCTKMTSACRLAFSHPAILRSCGVSSMVVCSYTEVHNRVHIDDIQCAIFNLLFPYKQGLLTQARLVLDRPPLEGYGRGAWGAAGKGDVDHVAVPRERQREGRHEQGKGGRRATGQRDQTKRA